MKNYQILLTVVLVILVNVPAFAQEAPHLDNIAIMDSRYNERDMYLGLEGKTEDVSYWEVMNFRLNTTPEVVPNHRFTFELFKDGDSTAYWSKSRVSNPYCCFASQTTAEGLIYTGWKADTAASAAPPVAGSYVIKVTLTDAQQNPIDSIAPFVREFTITGVSTVEELKEADFKFSHFNNQLHIKTKSLETTSVSVYSINGTLQLKKEFRSTHISIPTNFTPGIFLVKVSQGAKTGSYKIAIN